MPASASARISSRVNQRASSISEPSTSMTVSTRAGGEAHHQARGKRPRLAAEVGHLPHPDTGLLLDLAAHRVLHRLARLHEPRQRRVPALGPGRASTEQRALLGAPRFAVGDHHDHRGVRARELVAAAAGAVQHVARHPGFESAAAPGAVPRRPQPLGQADRVQHEGTVGDGLLCQRLHAPRAGPPTRHVPPGPSSGSTITAKCTTPSRSPSRTRSPSGASSGETQARRPSIGRTRAPAITSTRVAGSAQRSSSHRRRRAAARAGRGRAVTAPRAAAAATCS